MKLTPAALLAFTRISFVARTEVAAGAMRFSCATGWPSAVMATEEFSEARMIRVKGGSGLGFEGCARGGMILVTSDDVSAGAGFSDELCGDDEEGIEGTALLELLALLPFCAETLAGSTGLAAALGGVGAVEVGVASAGAAGCDTAAC